ncbi:MAG: tRNA (guanosine(46)-N7)-methyltransferase TrmB [Bacillaceae bacterium]|nr:tRNA (guanosine(46)-N7)-methyltransferase TrmB [Bacillaceae bacterium]
MRLRNKPWANEYLVNNPTIVIQNPDDKKGKWSEVFKNNHPIHVEVGTGKGQFLTGMAELHPNINYIGVEKYDSVILTAVDRIKEKELSNFKLLNEDVNDLRNFLSEGEVDQIYINFTDPWPKTRHEKRRLTHERFLEMYEYVLKEKGEIHFKTDNQGLFEYSLHSFSKYGLLLNNVSLDLHNSDIEGNVMTEYEQKFSEKGYRIYRCEAKFK